MCCECSTRSARKCALQRGGHREPLMLAQWRVAGTVTDAKDYSIFVVR